MRGDALLTGNANGAFGWHDCYTNRQNLLFGYYMSGKEDDL